MKTIIEKLNQSKCRVVEPNPNGYIYIIIPAQGTLEKRRWKESERIRAFPVRLYLLVISETKHIMSHQHGYLHRSEQDNKRHPK